MTDSPKKSVRVRFAPAPTGPLHVGSVRTALFNWLFARQNDGKFVLRIEDTDIERSEAKYEKDILESLKWLGLDWDEGVADAPIKNSELKMQNYIGEYGPYRQSERMDIYEKYLQKLLNDDWVYYCFCTKEELENERQAMISQGLAPKYSGKCRALSKEESEERIAKGEEAVIRFKMPSVEVEFNDLIRGKLRFDAGLIGDIVIAKNLKSPLFIFAGLVDDFEMKITHVIRGEDHLSNTPKQILIGRALGFDEIKYAHLPLILAPDRSKLSKRYLETSVDDYRKQGYLSEAMINFLALLGWHPVVEQNSLRGKSLIEGEQNSGQDEPLKEKEIFTIQELINEFEIKRVQKAGAVFNIEKLDWFNTQYIKNSDATDLAEQLKDFIPDDWFENKELLVKIIELDKERMKKLSDFKDLADFFFKLPDYEEKLLAWQNMPEEKILANLQLLSAEIEKISEADFTIGNLTQVIMPLTEVWGRGELLWPLRAALSGKQASPGPFEIMEILGKEESLKRIKVAIKKVK
ncbi:MAG: glutamate--tRNA ligase [Patescibacteria group bacterium]